MKKVLSFVLVLSLVLSSFSMAFAGETKTTGLSDIAGVANEEAINVVNDLGIVTGYEDGTFKADKAVKRAEFAVMITKALGVPESALAGYTATNFTDVVGYEWAVPYLAFCESKGIISGYGEGIVKPGNTITVNEAMTMVLRALGYTPNSAVLVGTWPSNYVTLAQDLDLYDDVKAVATVDRGSAAQVIYNALTVGKVQVDADGQTIGVAGGANMLTSGLDCDPTLPFIITDAHVEDSLINLGKYMGAYAVAYLNDDDEIVAIGEVKSTFLTGEFNDAKDEFETTDEVVYKVPTTISAISAATPVAIEFANNSAIGALTDYVTGSTITIAVDVTGKTINKVYSQKAWTIDLTVDGVAQQVEADDLEAIEEDQEFLGLEFALTDEDEIDYDLFTVVGVNSLKDIKEDNIVYVYTYQAGEYAGCISRIVVGTAVVEGKITDYDTDGIWTIAGKDYELATDPAPSSLDGLDHESVGDTFKFFLDGYGDIFVAEEVESVADTYGIVTYYAAEGIEDAKIKMYTSEDKTKTFAVDSDVATDDLEGVLGLTDASTSAALIGYSLDKDGIVDAVDTTVTTVGISTVGTKTLQVSGGATYFWSKDTVVFTVDADGDFAMASVDGLEDTLTQAEVIADEDMYVLAILVDDAEANASADSAYAVYHTSTRTYDEALDDAVMKVTGFVDGKAFTKNTNDLAVADTVTIGALFEVEYDADGYISAVTEVTTGDDWVVYGNGDLTSVTISALEQDKTVVITSASEVCELADDVVVYYYDADEEEYTLSRVSALRTGYKVVLFSLDEDDNSEIDVVIFTK